MIRGVFTAEGLKQIFHEAAQRWPGAEAYNIYYLPNNGDVGCLKVGETPPEGQAVWLSQIDDQIMGWLKPEGTHLWEMEISYLQDRIPKSVQEN